VDKMSVSFMFFSLNFKLLTTLLTSIKKKSTINFYRPFPRIFRSFPKRKLRWALQNSNNFKRKSRKE